MMLIIITLLVLLLILIIIIIIIINLIANIIIIINNNNIIIIMITIITILILSALSVDHIHHLPSDIMRRILAYATASDFVDEGAQLCLPRKRAERSLRLVCKKWNEAIDEDDVHFNLLQKRCRVLGEFLKISYAVYNL